MLKKLKITFIVGLMSAVAISYALPATAQEKDKSPKTENKEKKKRDVYPFTGKVTSVDKVNKKLLVNGADGDRVFNITSETRIMKAGKPATLDDAAVGEQVSGQAKKAGELVEAVSVYIGPRPEGKGGGKKKKDEEKK